MNKEIDALVAKVFGSGLDERECSVMTKEDFLDALLEARALGLEEAAKVCCELAELNRTVATDSMWQWYECAAAIRALKGE